MLTRSALYMFAIDMMLANTPAAVTLAPALIACFRGTYRFVVLIKALDLEDVRKFLREQGLHLRTDVAIDIDPITVM